VRDAPAARGPKLNANQITKARADAEQSVIQQEAEGRGQRFAFARSPKAEAAAITMKGAGVDAVRRGLLDLRRLELAPDLTREVAERFSTVSS